MCRELTESQDSYVTSDAIAEKQKPDQSCSNNGLFSLNQEKAAVGSLINLAGTYVSRCHPASQLKKQVCGEGCAGPQL